MDAFNKKSHEHFMRKCIELAEIAKKRGDSPVGSMIVKDGEAIAHGVEGGKTNKDITFHAEIEAIRRATEVLQSSDLSSCLLYTSHEPCIMCSYVIRHHKIKTIVVGTATGEIGGYSSRYPILLDKSVTKWGEPPEIIDHILENECKQLHL